MLVRVSPVARDAGYPAIWGGKVAARAGIEPATNGLTVRHSATELPGREVEREKGFEPSMTFVSCLEGRCLDR